MDKLHAEILNQYRLELSGSSDHTLKGRVFYAGKFLDFAQGKPLSDWNGALVKSFERHMEAEDYSPGTIRNVHGIVKRVFDAARIVHERERTRLISAVDPNKPSAVADILKAMSLPPPTWDLGKRSAPKVNSEDVVKPSSNLEQIAAMIEAVRDDVEAAAYLSLSSIYGLRRGELCSVEPDHLDFTKNTLYVMTEKGGERRHQLLCAEIIPILRDYGFKRRLSSFAMSSLYAKICYKAGIKPEEGSGWHSFRRFALTAVRDSLPKVDARYDYELAAKIFFRWRLSSSSEMAERYYSQNALDIDGYVLRYHPIVPLWKGDRKQ